MPRFPRYGVLLYQILKMINHESFLKTKEKIKDPPREIKCFEGAGRKEVSCAGFRGRVLGAGDARGGVGLCPPPTAPPLRRRMMTLTGAGRCRLMHGRYGHGAGTSAGRLRVFSSIQAAWQVLPQACPRSCALSRKSRTQWVPVAFHRHPKWTCAWASPRTAAMFS